MSGGIAYVLDRDGRLPRPREQGNGRAGRPERRRRSGDASSSWCSKHVEYTGSARGQYVLDNWDELLRKFVKVMPVDYKRALARSMKTKQQATHAAGELAGGGAWVTSAGS